MGAESTRRTGKWSLFLSLDTKQSLRSSPLTSAMRIAVYRAVILALILACWQGASLVFGAHWIPAPAAVMRAFNVDGVVKLPLVDPITERELGFIVRRGHLLSPAAEALMTSVKQVSQTALVV